jgi:hypothetical protein
MNANKGLLLESTDVLAAPSLFNDLFCGEVRSVLPSPPVGDERASSFGLPKTNAFVVVALVSTGRYASPRNSSFFRVHSRLFAVVLSYCPLLKSIRGYFAPREFAVVHPRGPRCWLGAIIGYDIENR